MLSGGVLTFDKNASSVNTLIPTCANAFDTSRHALWATSVIAAAVKAGVWFPPPTSVGMAIEMFRRARVSRQLGLENLGGRHTEARVKTGHHCDGSVTK